MAATQNYQNIVNNDAKISWLIKSVQLFKVTQSKWGQFWGRPKEIPKIALNCNLLRALAMVASETATAVAHTIED